MVFKIKHFNHYQFDHEMVNKKIKGDLTYIGQVFDSSDQSWAFYHAANPDRSKGHKEYVMLCPTHISGREGKEAIAIAETSGIFCTSCVTYVYSPHRHVMVYCECGENFIDGGNSYIRCSAGAIPMQFNLITKQFKIMGLKDDY